MSRRTLLAVALLAATVAPPAAAATCSVDQEAADQAFVTCSGVHPGMAVVVRSNRGWATCVAGFAFADQHGNRYLTIPGSCVLVGECRWPALLEAVPEIVKEIAHGLICEHVPHHEEKRYTKPALVTDHQHRRLGVVTYAVNVPGEKGWSGVYQMDFALVRLDKGVRLNPALPYYGGPTRLGEFVEAPDEAYAFSPPDAETLLPNARKAPLLPPPVMAGSYSRQARFHHSGVLSWNGTSIGTPVMRTDGAALGFYGSDSSAVLGFSTLGSYRTFLARAQRFTGLRLRLLTAPLAR